MTANPKPGQALRLARKEHGVSSTVLATQLGTSTSAVSYAESGQRPLPLRWLHLMPPELAVPVIAEVIEEHNSILVWLWTLLQEKKKSRQGGLPGPGGDSDMRARRYSKPRNGARVR